MSVHCFFGHHDRLFARMHEVYAGFLNHTGAQIGRLFDHLEALGQLENTIVVAISDNGASPEGGPVGRFNEMTMFNGIAEEVDDLLKRIDELGSPTTDNRYPAWNVAATDNNVFPVGHGASQLVAEKPAAAAPHSRYVYYPGTSQIPEGTTHDVRDRSHSIEANVTIPSTGAEGVLFAQGGRFGGFVLYVDNAKLVYDYNLAGTHMTVRSDVSVPVGEVLLRMEFTARESRSGDVILTANGSEIGRGHIDRTILTRYTLDEGFDIGRDLGTPVCDAYECPAVFTGQLAHLTIDIHDPAPEIDVEAHRRTALGRQ